MVDATSPRCIEAVRRFSRFYTRQLGLLRDGSLGTSFSATQRRVIDELAHRGRATAAELSHELGIDPGYLSRILRSFEQHGLVDRRPSETDGRQTILQLTRGGHDAFTTINARSQHEIAAMVERLTPADRERLAHALGTAEELLSAPAAQTVPYILRPPQPGDMGWIVHRHGVLYAREYGWDERLEACVAGIVGGFVERHDAQRERCWVAEVGMEVAGSVLLVKQSEAVATLRLLYVEPNVRGVGIGSRLVDECVRFARQAGYRWIRLWTPSVLTAARRIFERAGFLLVHQEPHRDFGHDLVGEARELRL
jgi:DNA-binding MarR family transcriptional regulator/N-acetylglutamate synthase-like GNAT family acetyltransferase